MQKIARHTILLLMLLCRMMFSAEAQQGFYVPDAAKVFFKGDSSTIFSNVINNGNIGIGKQAVLNFKGKSWDNSPQSHITDDTQNGTGVSGDGGWLRFIADTTIQQIFGGYNAATRSGAAFSRIMIDNPLGIELQSGSTKVLSEIKFNQGHVFLHDNIFSLGNNDPGKISGFNESNFFVTGNAADKGFLLRENIRKRDGTVVFPVGSHTYTYTPAAISHARGNADDYYVSVFDSVKQNGTSGAVMPAETVNKTWQIGKTHPNSGETTVVLQHRNVDEGSSFTNDRQNAFISQHNSSGWDTGFPQLYPAPGYLTTGTPILTAGVNARDFNGTISSSSLFTKMAIPGAAIPETKLWFNAYRLDTGRVKVYWTTNPEFNVRSFIVERRLSNESQFKRVDSVPSLALNGYSVNPLFYEITDPNNYTGISFYRLRLNKYNNTTSYSDSVAVGGVPGEYSIMLWPNPAPGNFFISIHKTLPAKAIVIWDAIGQKIKEVPVNGRNVIPMYVPTPGTYFAGVILTTGVIIETKKFVIAGN